MTRRITAAALALVMLLCAFPVSVRAHELEEIDKPAQPYWNCPVYDAQEGRTYYEGEFVWIKGHRAKPSENDLIDQEKYNWFKMGIRRCGDGLLEHVADESCYGEKEDGTYGQICGIDYDHVHNSISGCMNWDAYWLYKVTIDPDYKDDEADPDEPDEPEEPDTPVDDGFNEATGEMYFEVLCVNAKGEPMPYVSFGIATAKTDSYGNIQYNSEGMPLMNSNGGIAFKTTNKDGKLRFNSLEKHLGAGKYQPWIVYQDGGAFIKNPNTGKTGRYYNQYFFCDVYWSMPSGLTFSLVKDTIRDKEPPVIQPGYNKGVLTYVNEQVRCMLDINVNFVDEDGDPISPSSCMVTVTPDKTLEGYPKQIPFPLAQSSRNDPWGDSIYDLPAGRYTVESDEPAAISGYSYLNTTYELLVREDGVDVWKEANSADLGTDFEAGIFRIAHHYEQGIATNKICVRTVDEDNIGRSGATYQLYDPYSGLVKEFTNTDAESYIIDQDVSHAVEEGETKTLMLMQTLAPDYHADAEEYYEIDVTKTNGVVAMILRDENGDDGAVNGIQTATFVSRKSDQSNTIIVKAVEAGKAENGALPGGSYAVYENGEKCGHYELGEETTLRMDDFDFASRAEPGKTRVFELKQTVAPKGYFPSEEVYTITVTMESGKPEVSLAKVEEDPDLWTQFTRAIGLGDDNRGEYGEQIAQFHNKKAPGNRIVMESYAEDQEGVELEAVYILRLDDTEQIIADNLTHALDMTPYGREGESIRYSLEQSRVLDNGYELAENEFLITVTKLGGQVYTEVTEVTGDGSNVESGTEEQIVKFQNKKKPGVAKISISLAEIVEEWDENCEPDTQFMTGIRNGEYEFVLEWSHNGTEKQTSVFVQPKSFAEFDAELPLGAEYEVRPAAGYLSFHTEFTSKYQGVVSETQLEKTTNVTATNTFKITAGNYTPELELIKVDAEDINKVLPGAAFDLRGPDGIPFMTVTSDANGVIDISRALKEPAVHVMMETGAPDGYTKLEDPLRIEIAYHYDAAEVNGEAVLVQNLGAFASHPDEGILIYNDGKYYVKNMKNPGDAPTAEIHLVLDMRDPTWGKGSKTDTSYLKDEYSFALTWQNIDGKKQSETISLGTKEGKNQGTFKTRLPIGTQYKIVPVGDDIIYNTTFTGGDIEANGTGTVTTIDGANVIARVEHTFVAGTYKPELYMVKVNAKNLNRTLAGAKFSLKDETGIILKTYLTQKDGAIEIIDDVLDDYPTTYTLTEIAAPEEYAKLKTPINIALEYEYVPRTGTNGKITATQNLVANVHHESVEKGSDGWYYIKNTHTSDIPQTADRFNPVLWATLLTVSVLGLGVVSVNLFRKKRRTR